MKKMETYKVTPTQVRKAFVKYTQHNIPSGKSHKFYDKVPRYNATQYFDAHGNVYCIIGDRPRVMFAAHMDDVSNKYAPVEHEIDNRYVRATHGGVLGADDKSGTTIMEFLMKHNVPGVYAFFVDEESGCQGSSASATDFNNNRLDLYQGNPLDYGQVRRETKTELRRTWDKLTKDYVETKYDVTHEAYDLKTPKLPAYLGESGEHPLRFVDIVISFDRRGYDSIVTQQGGYTTASDAFAVSLSDELAKYGVFMSPDPTGVFTDSREFAPYIAECTNISVGYFDQHSHAEYQDILFMTTLINALLQMNWDNLVVARKPEPRLSYRSKSKSKSYWWDKYDDFNEHGMDNEAWFETASQGNKEDEPIIDSSFLPPTTNENLDDAFFCQHCDLEYNKHEVRDFAYDLYSEQIDKESGDLTGVSMDDALLFCEDCGHPLITVEGLFELEAEINVDKEGAYYFESPGDKEGMYNEQK